MKKFTYLFALSTIGYCLDSCSNLSIANDVKKHKEIEQPKHKKQINKKISDAKPTIAIIAPSNKSMNNDNDTILKNIKKMLTKSKFNVVIPKDLIGTGNFREANSTEYKINHFTQTLLDTNIDCIWAFRGGRGASELFLDKKFWKNVKRKLKNIPPKMLVGFSDATALHLYVNNVLNWPSLHGALLNFNKEVCSEVNEKTSLRHYFDIIKGKIEELKYELTPKNECAKNAEVKGKILGGNLSLIQRSIGTFRQPKFNNKIFFTEDTGEAGSKINEMLVHLDAAEVFKGMKAVILGNFQGEDEKGIKEAIEKFSKEMEIRKIPVFSYENFGHGACNWPLPLNTAAQISKGKLLVSTGCNNTKKY